MTVSELIAELQKMPGDVRVSVQVTWAGDSALGDEEDDPIVYQKDGVVTVEAWMSNCGTELEFVEEEDS